jgi:hypothetical protein
MRVNRGQGKPFIVHFLDGTAKLDRGCEATVLDGERRIESSSERLEDEKWEVLSSNTYPS